MKLWIHSFILFTLISCEIQQERKPEEVAINSVQVIYKFDSVALTDHSTIYSRFLPPEGFERVKTDARSFGDFLQNLPLKPRNAPVMLYNSQLKPNQRNHAAVIDLPIGSKNLHQCADAIIRLRADYFYKKQAFDSIRFHFTSGFLAEYERWRSGDRIRVIGNDVNWVEGNHADTSRKGYWNYLEQVFMYAGTLSLEKELKPKSWDKLSIGDVLIQGGSPGHAVIVVDVAKNEAGEKVFMLAQSYMPAQDMHILKNPRDPKLSPWYRADFSGNLDTPEWTFSKDDLQGF